MTFAWIIAATVSVALDRLFSCLESLLYLVLSSAANQYIKIYTLATEGLSCGFEECNQRSKVAIKSEISQAVAQLISAMIMKRMKLVVVYKPRGARVNSVLHVKHRVV